MNQLNTARRCQVVAALVEGNSIRSTVRMTGVAKNTVTKLLVDLGAACAAYHDEAMVNLPCRRLQLDEIWSFCYSKQKNVPEDKRGQLGYGDVWTWTSIDADTKLVPSWLVGARDAEYACEFVNDLASRLANRVQITTDGHKAYLQAIEGAFNGNVDYSMLLKTYGLDPQESERRYSPSVCTGCTPEWVCGQPDEKHVSTSYVERQNLTMRMKMRRFTRLTNAFSKKIDNLAHAVALHFMHYNFGRIHQTLRITPAMAAGVSDHLWRMEEIVGLLERYPQK
jgi:IS1 family transposase